MATTIHGVELPPLGGGRWYKSSARAARAVHCRKTVVIERREVPGRPGVFRDVVESPHVPEPGAYDAHECRRVKCPNRKECAYQKAHASAVAQVASSEEATTVAAE